MSGKRRYRQIHCMIWSDDKFPFVGDDCQLVFFHLMTTPMGNPFGLFKAGVAALAEEKRWDLDRYTKGLGEGLGEGFIEQDKKALLIYLPNFLKYNPPHNPNVVRSWGILFHELPESQLKEKFFQVLKAYCEKTSKGLREGFRKGFGERYAYTGTVYRNSNISCHIPKNVTGEREDVKPDSTGVPKDHVGEDPEKNGNSRPDGYTEEFEATWKLYPGRSGSNNKKTAFKAYKARVKSGANELAIQAGVIRYAAFVRHERKENTVYVLMASTFFGPNEHWMEKWDATGGEGQKGPVAPSTANKDDDWAKKAKGSTKGFLEGDGDE